MQCHIHDKIDNDCMLCLPTKKQYVLIELDNKQDKNTIMRTILIAQERGDFNFSLNIDSNFKLNNIPKIENY
tara:strand:- start:617 stop:832 length:216 start_codon:yes stop_codon:yes gene_type:complete